MLSTFATLYKRNHFSIARTFRTMTLIRSILSSGRSRIWSHTCAMTASFALSTGCGSANSSASEMSSARTIFSSVLMVGLLSPRSRCPRKAGLISACKASVSWLQPRKFRKYRIRSPTLTSQYIIVTCPLILAYPDNWYCAKHYEYRIIIPIDDITEPVNKSGHEKYYFLNFKSRHHLYFYPRF